MRELPFDPSQAYFFPKYIKNKKQPKDGSPPARHGPYWYAGYIQENRHRLHYIGKELPEELVPYIDHGREQKLAKQGRKPSERIDRPYNSFNSIQASLDDGNQVVINITNIAQHCKARIETLDNYTFVLYRDPIEEKHE